MIAHCLFEQSGTFKNEFKKTGIDAYDYDILNDFGQTDHLVDLFKEIEKAYDKKSSIFDDITQNDVIMAFFPCIMFSCRFELNSRAENAGMNAWSLKEKIKYSMEMQNKRARFYELLSKMILVCLDKKLKLIIENPYHQTQHFLCVNAPYKASYIDFNRANHGDDFKKPTQFFFFNCKPKFNLIEEVQKRATKRVSDLSTVERSMINPDYASWFIKAMILDGEQVPKNKESLF